LKLRLWAALLLALLLIGSDAATSYIYERSVVKGVGYRSHELMGQTAPGYAGQKFVEGVSGSGRFYDSYEFEVDNDNINFTQETELEYFPVSYQTGTYDRKWTDRICAANYDIGAVVTEAYTHAEYLQKSTEIRAGLYDSGKFDYCCTGVLEASFNSQVIGVAHIGWLSRDPTVSSKGRHSEWGRSIEDLTGVFSVEKFIQLWGNSTCGAISVDWLPCL